MQEKEGDIKILSNKNISLTIFVGLLFIFIISNVTALTVTLSNPQNNSNFAEGADVNFNCTVDAPNGINYLEVLSNYDRESALSVLYTFNKGSFGEPVIGGNYSVNYYNEYINADVVNNPTYVIDGEGNTCGGVNDPCNNFEASSGNEVGGYWRPTNVLATTYFTLTLNDTFAVNQFILQQHGTFYANASKLEYSLDGTNWNTIFEKSTTASINEIFSPVIAKYLKWSATDFASVSGIYTYQLNITGRALNSSVPFNSSLNYTYSGLGGGSYLWNCKAYTNAENLTGESNFTFTMNGTSIDWVNPTPASGTETTYLKINTSISSDYDAYGFFNRDSSLTNWYTFDDSSNRLQSVNNEWGNALTFTGTASYPTTTFQEGVLLENGESISGTNILVGNNDLGLTLVWSMNLSNASACETSGDWIYNTDYATVGGFNMRMQEENSTDCRFYLLLYNATGHTNVAPKITFPKSYQTVFKRYALTMDFVNQQYKFYSDGNLVSTATSSADFNFYDHGNDLTFRGRSYFDVLLDDIMFLNISVTDEEGKLLSNYSSTNYFAMDYSSDTNVTIKPYGYDAQGTVTTTDTRTFNFLVSPIIEYTHIFNDNNETLWSYCRATFGSALTESINHIMQYSTDNSTWSDLTETYHENNETYAIIGDSMSNEYSDWPGYLTDNFNLSDTTLPTYAVAGSTCTQVYNQLVVNVTNDTINLFSTCGVNGGIPSTNTQLWEDIYNESKAKNISKIYMTTMPPWDTINTYDDETAQTKCDLQKSQNQWLIDFAANKSDLEVVDLWTFYHDTSGTNKTDCGWRTDIAYSDDGIHPNAQGMEYWADRYWKLFNEWSNDTFEASLTPDQSTTYYFRCSTNGDRPSLISYMGELDVIVDHSGPDINITQPINGSSLSFPGSVSVTLNVTANDTSNISSYWYNIDGGTNVTFNQTVSIGFTIATGQSESHTIYVFVNDTYNNVNSSSVYFTLYQTGTVETSSTSGSSLYTPPFWENTYREDSKEFVEIGSIDRQMKKQERMQILFGGEIHRIGIIDIYNKTVIVNVSSDPQQAKIPLGGTAKFDINNNSYYDLKVYVSNIVNNVANISVSYLHEKIPAYINDTKTPSEEEQEPTDEDSRVCGIGKDKSISKCFENIIGFRIARNLLGWFILGICIILIIVIILEIKKKKKSHFYH